MNLCCIIKFAVNLLEHGKLPVHETALLGGIPL